MAVNLTFSGSEKSETQEHSLKMFHNTKNEIYLTIEMPDQHELNFVCFDKETAIKFSKELRKQISYITDEEVYNG
jgi:hypothetical protein